MLDLARIRTVQITVHITWIRNILAAARDGNCLIGHPIITGTVTGSSDEMYSNDVNELPCVAKFIYM